jgi:hypothetical protein
LNFKNAQDVEAITWQIRQDEFGRGKDRAFIDALFNGNPPYTPQEVADNGISVNVNDMTGVKLAHDARAQMYSAMMSTGQYFSCETDTGPVWKRDKWNTIVTNKINRIMKNNQRYFETGRSQIAQTVLHGIAPSGWDDKDRWRPRSRAIDEVGILSGTALDLENLPLFYVRRSYTAPQLIKLTRGDKVDPAWNIPLVDSCIKWVDDQAQILMSNPWPDVWSPEKQQERLKGDGSCYATSRVSTVDVFDFYYWSDEGDVEGWRRRMTLDAWSTPGPDGLAATTSRRFEHGQGQFLYNSGSRVFADQISHIINWQFADLSAVSPFQYHSVRSLGLLIYGVCFLQNRLYCKFSEAVFENLMMYMRVKSLDDAERALKIELANRGFIDESVQFLRPEERWQINEQLALMGLQTNEKIITGNASSFIQRQNFQESKTEKTKFQVQAEVNASTALIGAAVLQAYAYKKFEFIEIFRRFCKENSRDVDVRSFRNDCLKEGVPPEVLRPECWNIEPEKVLGGGNKTAQLQISEWLMQHRPEYDPEPQRQILRRATFNVTDDAALTDLLVPEKPVAITDSVHDAQLSVGTLMDGLPIEVKTGMNHIEYIQTYLTTMQMVLQKIEARGGEVGPDELDGLQNVAGQTIEGQPVPSGGVTNHLDILAQDPQQQEAVKKFTDALAQMMNAVKELAHNYEKQMQAQQAQGNGQLSPEAQAKIVEAEILAKGKDARAAQSHADKTAQRQVQFDMQQRQAEEKHQADLRQEAVKTGHEIAQEDAWTQADIAMEQERVDNAPAPKAGSE